jgi:preprotein translocase subunit SecA
MEIDEKRVEAVRASMSKALDFAVSNEDISAALALLSPKRLVNKNRNLVRAVFPDDSETMLANRTAIVACAAGLAALAGRHVHVATTKQLIAELEAAALGAGFASLGLSVGCLLQGVSFRYDPVIAADTGEYTGLYGCTRPEAFGADVVYGSFYEFGFNRLQLQLRASGVDAPWLGVDCPFDLMLIEDVDAFVADVSPIAITGQGPDRSAEVMHMTALVSELVPREGTFGGDFEILRDKTGEAVDVRWLDQGAEAIAEHLGFVNAADIDEKTRQLAGAVLIAQNVYKRDRDYIVADGEILPISTDGKLWIGRRLNGGLHNALEAKEHLVVQKEGEEITRITPNAYLDLYLSVAGIVV